MAFETPLGVVKAVEDLQLHIDENETVALVGETGCGKSVVASSILKLLPGNAIVSGQVIYRGRNLLEMDEKELSRIRGSEIALMFQNPSLALNPVYRAGEQIAEPLQIHKGVSKKGALEAALDQLKRFHLGDRGTMNMYPFQLSGGMNQRVMISASVILSPKILIADEPTKGLDHPLAEDMMHELERVKESNRSSLLLITHDLELAREISDRMAVMYCGQILEIGESKGIFSRPLHPYTKALLDSLPERGFKPLNGSSPSMINPPSGCKFHPRCSAAIDECLKDQDMKKVEGSSTRLVRCRLY